MLIHSYKNSGGIGDFIRSLFAYFVFCKQNNIEYKLFFINDYKKCFKNVLKELPDNCLLFQDVGSKATEKTHYFLNELIKNKDQNYIVISNIFDFIPFDVLFQHTSEFVEFLTLSDELQFIINNKMPKGDFSTIHARFGDAFMKKINIASDSRLSIKDAMNKINLAIEYLNGQIVLATDFEDVKLHIINNVNATATATAAIISLQLNVYHTALDTNDKESVEFLESVAEFFIIGHSKKIVMISNSGFSFWSAFIHQIPLFIFKNGEIKLLSLSSISEFNY